MPRPSTARKSRRGNHEGADGASLAWLLRLILFVLPLGLDTFAVSAALGMRGLPPRDRLRVSSVMAGFEMAMPVVGLLLGNALGRVIGTAADYVAIGVLAILGVWMLVHDDDDDDEDAVERLATGHGPALIALGLSISLDELAMGFTIGLLHLSLWAAIVLIGAQAFLFSQIGLRLGSRISESMRERAERLAGLVLLGLAVLLTVEHL